MRIGANQFRHFVYDEQSHLIGEYDYLGRPVVEYVWLGDKPVAALYPNNQVVFLMTDHTNTPRRGLDLATDELVWAWDPDAFGVSSPHIDTVEMNLRFPGQYYDQATGLHYNHNRYYAPDLGRYLEPDPIGLEGGRNPYSYAGNDPVNKVDPSGLYVKMNDMQMSNFTAFNNSIDPGWLNSISLPSTSDIHVTRSGLTYPDGTSYQSGLIAGRGQMDRSKRFNGGNVDLRNAPFQSASASFDFNVCPGPCIGVQPIEISKDYVNSESVYTGYGLAAAAGPALNMNVASTGLNPPNGAISTLNSISGQFLFVGLEASNYGWKEGDSTNFRNEVNLRFQFPGGFGLLRQTGVKRW